VKRVYQEHFDGKNWSDDERTQNTVTKHAEATIELGNIYVRRVVENNARVMDLLEKNWHLMDAADVEVLSRFQVDYTRYLVEATGKGGEGLPFGVVVKLGAISFMHPDTTTRARETFQRKRARLIKLTGVKEQA
jgi:hypothetical protein